MASRGTPGVLESTSLTSLNAINGPSAPLPPLKRRKIFHADDVEQTSSSQTVFTVKGHASSLSDNEFKLAPIELLPRSALPFSWLDTSTAIQSNNIFASNDAVLEGMFIPREGAEQPDTEPSVLATRSLSNGAIYVVERVKMGIFAMTKLQSNIEEGEIRVAAKAAAAINFKNFRIWSSNTDRSTTSKSTNGWDWREAARLPDGIPQFDSFATKGKFDVSVAFEDCSGDDHGAAAIESQVYTGDSFMALDGFVPDMQEYTRTPPDISVEAPRIENQGDAQDTSPTPDVTMENLRTQYLEALYISKTSVAYFAKGPLTRCRNAFAQYSPDEDVPSLSSQYRESILSVKKMDAKYRETLPVILRNMTLLLSDDERSKKRKSKKKKLGKNGLYTGEDEFLQKYWKSRQISKNKEGAEESKEEEIKRHISDLRLRETQLQILLILETIHLEIANVAPSIEESKRHEASTTRSKSKKEENLNLLLELFIDRLCIWHAISAGEGVIAESLKETNNNHLSGKKIESDALRDFCNEVIIPFYASRLPEQCKTIKKKLGGASEASPNRSGVPKLKPSTSNSGSKGHPGVSDGKKTQPQQQKPRRTLQRVLTDEQASVSQRSRHPSLMRSSTTPALQEVKRESVEPSLPSLGGSVRGGIQIARRVDKREVDLNAVAKVHEAKLKKMNTLIEQKKELDAAINALRKPNRELVSKEVADQAEKRTFSSSRKSRNPVRNPLGQGVQVMATPRGTRKKDMSIEHQSQPSLARGPLARPSMMKHGVDETSPDLGSDISLVPGSTIRTNTLTSSIASKRKFNSITETPSRGVSRRSGALSLMDDHEAEAISVNTPASSIPCNRALFKVPSLPAMTARSTDERMSEPENSDIIAEDMILSIDQTPPAKNKTFFTQQLSAPKPVNLTASSPPVPVFETPVKTKPRQKTTQQDDSAQVIQSTPVKSIYEALGWDDDDDDDLAL